jgi:hypothetical protein
VRRRIFVFGSNLLGIHGAGAARAAVVFHGAERGVGTGLTGDSYALPTCKAPGVPLPLDEIVPHTMEFVRFAAANPDMDFLLTAVGCGIAGHKPAEIFALFGRMPDNVYVQAKLAQATP